MGVLTLAFSSVGCCRGYPTEWRRKAHGTEFFIGNTACEAVIDCVERLLQERKVIPTIDATCRSQRTALFAACATVIGAPSEKLQIIEMLLYADADPTITDNQGRMPLQVLRQHHPNNRAAIAFLEHATSFMSFHGYHLIKARHILATHPCHPYPNDSFLLATSHASLASCKSKSTEILQAR